jgi:proteasome accessory factor B
VGSQQSPDQRVMSLLMLLLEAQGPVSREEIFQRIPSYRTADPLAGERKFERDKEELRAVGVPIEQIQGENVYLVHRRDYELRPVQLDNEERIALILAVEALRGSEGLVYRELVDDALRKLSFDNGRLGPGTAPAHLAITLPVRERSARMRKRMEIIGKAIEGRKRLTITYVSGGAETTRDVDPYAAVYTGGNWQLVGHCHLRSMPRTFRVDRIRKLKLAARPGSPDFERPANFSLASYVQRSPWVFQAGESKQAVDVVLDIGPERAWVADEDFGAQALREPLPADQAGGEGWTRVCFRSGNLVYIVTRVLDGVGHLRLVEPAELRARVREVAARVAGACQMPVAT